MSKHLCIVHQKLGDNPCVLCPTHNSMPKPKTHPKARTRQKPCIKPQRRIRVADLQRAVDETTGLKTPEQIRERIRNFRKTYEHVLTGRLATVHINAPRALAQLSAETTLATLHWCLGETYKSKLNGVDR